MYYELLLKPTLKLPHTVGAYTKKQNNNRMQYRYLALPSSYLGTVPLPGMS